MNVFLKLKEHMITKIIMIPSTTFPDSVTSHLQNIEEIFIVLGLLVESCDETDLRTINDTIAYILENLSQILSSSNNSCKGDKNIFSLNALKKTFANEINALINLQDAIHFFNFILQSKTSTNNDLKTGHLYDSTLCSSHVMKIDSLIIEKIENMKVIVIEAFKHAVWSINDDLLRQEWQSHSQFRKGVRITNGISTTILTLRSMIYLLYESCHSKHHLITIHAISLNFVKETVDCCLTFYSAIEPSRTRHSQYINDLKSLLLSVMATFQFILKSVVINIHSENVSITSEDSDMLQNLISECIGGLLHLVYIIYIMEESSVVPMMLFDIVDKAVKSKGDTSSDSGFIFDKLQFQKDYLEPIFDSANKEFPEKQNKSYSNIVQFLVSLYHTDLSDTNYLNTSQINGSVEFEDHIIFPIENDEIKQIKLEIMQIFQKNDMDNNGPASVIKAEIHKNSISIIKSILLILDQYQSKSMQDLSIHSFDVLKEFSLWGYVITGSSEAIISTVAPVTAVSSYIEIGKYNNRSIAIQTESNETISNTKANINIFSRLLKRISDLQFLNEINPFRCEKCILFISYLMDFYVNQCFQIPYLLSSNTILKNCLKIRISQTVDGNNNPMHSQFLKSNITDMCNKYVIISSNALVEIMNRRREMVSSTSGVTQFPPYSESELSLQKTFNDFIKRL